MHVYVTQFYLLACEMYAHKSDFHLVIKPKWGVGYSYMSMCM